MITQHWKITRTRRPVGQSVGISLSTCPELQMKKKKKEDKSFENIY